MELLVITSDFNLHLWDLNDFKLTKNIKIDSKIKSIFTFDHKVLIEYDSILKEINFNTNDEKDTQLQNITDTKSFIIDGKYTRIDQNHQIIFQQ